jgi:hypothetical protein
MKRKAKPDFKALLPPPGSAPVDRGLWSPQSQRACSSFATYHDIEYACRTCGARAVFSALEQKRYFEAKKAHVDKRRVLCPACFSLSLQTVSDIRACERAWKENRRTLRADADFLSRWLESMVQYKRFQPYRHNFAIEAMIRKLMSGIAVRGAENP